MWTQNFKLLLWLWWMKMEHLVFIYVTVSVGFCWIYYKHSCLENTWNESVWILGRGRKKYICLCISATLGVCGSVYVWMLDQVRWWSSWLVLAELISQFPGLERAERQSPLLPLPRPSWLFLMRQVDWELSHWRGCLTYENETPWSAC